MIEKKAIVFINQHAGYLMVDIINAHLKYEHRYFITGKVAERNVKLDNNVKINKIILYNRSSTIKRLFTWAIGFIQICWLVKTRYRKADLFIVTNPPFAGLLPLLCTNRFSLLIYDVYPDALEDYKFFGKHSMLTALWRKANKKVFKKAANIFTISEGMKKKLNAYAAADTIKVIPLWSHNDFVKPVNRAGNLFLKQHSLHDKFLVMYSGNMGRTHHLEVIIEMARKIKDEAIDFIIIGDGEKRQLLQSLIEKSKLTNCKILPWQNIDMLPHTLSAADVGIVSIGKEASMLSVPSKTYDLLSAGTPLLCIADASSELAALVNKYHAGEIFDPHQTDQMTDFIYRVKSDRNYRSLLHHNALNASKDFEPVNAFKFAIP